MVRGQRSSAQKPRAGTHTLAQAPRRAPSRHRGDGARRLSDSLITITASAERDARTPAQRSNTRIPAAFTRARAPMCARLATLCTAREGSRRSLINITASAERVGPLEERLIHHRVVRGHQLSALTHALRPRSRARGLTCVLVYDTLHGSRRLSESLITITASVERVEPLKERLIHNRVIRGHQLSAQTRAFRPRSCAHGLRCVLVYDTLHGSRRLSEEPNYYYVVG
eukprot:3535958-Prymnesium_polylepis.1